MTRRPGPRPALAPPPQSATERLVLWGIEKPLFDLPPGLFSRAVVPDIGIERQAQEVEVIVGSSVSEEWDNHYLGQVQTHDDKLRRRLFEVLRLQGCG
jgi:hypothetical protein